MWQRAAIQTVLETIFPPHCISCGCAVSELGALCANCWKETAFITGSTCDKCGVPLIGEPSDHPEYCDDCLEIERPWDKGRAALLYKDNGRKIVLALKHGDRLEIARPAGRWMHSAVREFVSEKTVVVPVPLHWTRFWRRRYNQSALLAASIAHQAKVPYVPDLLKRTGRTKPMDGLTRDERFALIAGQIAYREKRANQVKGKEVLLVDDVMTSGATLAASAEACLSAGAKLVCVVVLARVKKDAYF